MAKTKGDTVDDVIAAIGRTAELKDKIHKELGLGKDIVLETTADMYEFEYKKPDLEHRNYVILHGKCAAKWQKEKISWGYVFQQLRHFPKDDKQWCRVACANCKKQLDSKQAEIYLQERKIKLEKERQDYLEEKAIRAEWEAEQILLGKL
jgi:hypothetical protein